MKKFFITKNRDKIIETDRLILRPWTVSMASDLFEYAQDPQVGPIAGWKPHTSLQESINVIRQVYIPSHSFAIVIKELDKTVGSIGFQPDRRRANMNSREIGYSLSREYWNNGYMTEAVSAVLRYGFEELGYDTIAICTLDENKRSQRVINKSGFVYEGFSRSIGIGPKGDMRNEHCFSMLRSEWNELHNSKD